jgi:hypothetical protein
LPFPSPEEKCGLLSLCLDRVFVDLKNDFACDASRVRIIEWLIDHFFPQKKTNNAHFSVIDLSGLWLSVWSDVT